MSYWETRFSQLEASQHKTAEECLKNIDKQFRTATNELESKIDTWYGRFADNNGITMTEARKWLKADELEEFHWTVDDYIAYGQQNALSGEWMKQLENASAKTHIRRYEALETEMQESIEKLYNGEYNAINDTMREIYENGFYHSAFEIEKGTHVGMNLARLDERTISKVINTPWAVDGKNFSERIWDDKEKLINTLDQELVQNIILGEDPQKAIDAIAKAMNTSRNNAGRLVMTEEAYFSSVAQQDAFEELGVEEYEIVATLDSKTSEICAGLDGQHFPMKDYEAGVSAPPFHPNCRTTTCPYFEDNYGSIGERAMRLGDENSTEYISADTTYDNWAEKYLQEKTDSDKITDEDIGNRNYNSDYALRIGKENYDKMHDLLDECGDEDLQKVWAKYEDKIVVGSTNTPGTAYEQNGAVYVNMERAAKDSTWQPAYAQVIHEDGHAIDDLAGRLLGDGRRQYCLQYNDGEFLKTIKAETNNLVDTQAQLIKQEFKDHAGDWEYLHGKGYIDDFTYRIYDSTGKWLGDAEPKYSKSLAYKAVEKEIRNAGDVKATACISDILQGASNSKINGTAGHAKSYYSGRSYMTAVEAFAEMTESTVTNPASLEVIQKYLPKSYGVYKDILKAMI